MEEKELTDLDYKRAVIWVSCPACGADRNGDCISIPIIGLLEPGKTHSSRVRKWLVLKARVVSWSVRNPNCQQIPRSEPYKISEGGTKEAAEYWDNRNKLK